MPKEISHWYLADQVKSALPAESVFKEPVQTYENLFFLGAVAPDIPFYYLVGPKASRILAAAEPFHRPDAGALTPVLSFFDRMGGANADPGALSLGAGIISHIQADTAFHPLVYYYSGQSRVHPGAMARHREFETALDLYLLHQTGPGARISLTRTLAETEVARHRLMGYLAGLFNLNEPGDRTCLGYAVRSHACYQALFQNPSLYRFLKRLNKRPRRALDLALSLVYPPGQNGDLPFFRRQFHYQDPVTGRLCRAGIKDLTRQTVTSALSLLAGLSDQMLAHRPAISLPAGAGLPLIRPGIASCRFWRQKNSLLTDLYHREPNQAFPKKETFP
jgi:hypothetical protein